MINVSDTVKNLYAQDSIHKSLFIRVNSATGTLLSNADIHIESMRLSEILMSDDQLKFGGCNASQFEITVINTSVALKNGDVLYPFIQVTTTDGPYSINLGKFTITDIQTAKESAFRTITALDDMALFNVDVTDWYNGLTFPMTVKQYRNSLCTKIGVTQENVTLPYDNFPVNKYYTANEQVNGLKVLRDICELNARFGKMDRSGKLKYLYYQSTIAVTATNISSLLKQKPVFQNVVTNTINGINVYDDDGTMFKSNPSATNPYTFINNHLLYGRTEEELTAVANVVEYMARYNYYPCTDIKLKGLPYVETGDALYFNNGTDKIYFCVFKRELTGIQNISDSIVCEGKQYLEYNTNSITNQLLNLNRSDERMKVDIKSNADGLSAEITRATGAEGTLSSNITANANSISAEVTRATKKEGELSSSISAQAGQIALAVKKDTSYNGMKITDSGLSIEGDGAFTVNMNNFALDNTGNVRVSKGQINAQMLTVSNDEYSSIYGGDKITISPGTVDLYPGIFITNNSGDDTSPAIFISNLFGLSGGYTLEDGGEYGGFHLPIDRGGNDGYIWSSNFSFLVDDTLTINSGECTLFSGNVEFNDDVTFNILSDDYQDYYETKVGTNYILDIGDGTITGGIKEADTRINQLAYGNLGGKNLFDIDKTFTGDSRLGLTKTKNSIKLKTNSNMQYASTVNYLDFDNMTIGETYTLSADITYVSGVAKLGVRKNGGGMLASTANITASGRYKVTFTLTSEMAYVSLFATYSTTSAGEVTYSNIQLEKGASDTSYEPCIPYSVKGLCDVATNTIISKSFAGDSTTFTANQMKYIDFKDKVTIPSGYKIISVRDNTNRANLMGSPAYVRADKTGVGLNYFATAAMTVTPGIVVTFAKESICDSLI